VRYACFGREVSPCDGKQVVSKINPHRMSPRSCVHLLSVAQPAQLLRANQAAYWRDVELQEANYEALERRESAGAPVEARQCPDRLRRHQGPRPRQQRHDEIVGMMRDPSRSREYWRSQTIQQEFPDVVTRLSGEASASSLTCRRRP
jgi:hypothetical protein